MEFFKQMSILGKMLFSILLVSVLIYSISFGYIIINLRQKTFDDATQLANTQAREYAYFVTKDLNYDFDLTRGMGWAFQGFENVDHRLMDDFYNEILRIFIEKNPNFYSTWVSWELNAVLPGYDLPYGRVRHAYFRDNDRIDYMIDTLELDGDVEGSLYHQVKTDKQETITEPYWFSYTGLPEDMVLEVSPCIPLLINGHFAGLVGADIVLDRFQDFITSIKPFGVGYMFLLSNEGTFVGHPNENLLGENIIDTETEYESKFNIKQQIQKGEFISHFREDGILESEAYVAFAPVPIGNLERPWSLGIVVPVDYIKEEADRILFNSVLAGILGLFLLLYIIYIIARHITKPLKVTTNVLKTISEGDLNNVEKLEINTGDELGQIAKALNSLVDGIKRTADFANKIGEGKLDAEFELLGKNDILGNALLNMRESLVKAEKEEEKRKEEDNKRNWASHGHAMFADILRQNDDLNELVFKVIKNLVKYLNANQAGMFILNDDDPNDKFLELAACYAFDRRKYLQKSIKTGEGLVGATFLEKKTTYIEEVPQDYIHITSGLGGKNPDAILIIPLVVNEEAIGVIELASFNTFGKHEIEFVEKIAENIASTISSAKINAKTAYLLEQSQQQAEEMKTQEEEMRQNMEEMHATNEEIMRKEKELREQIELCNSFMAIMEFNQNGIITKVNELFARISGYQEEELIGKHHSFLFSDPGYKKSKDYEEFWEMMKTGRSLKTIFKRIGKNNIKFSAKGISYPVIDDNGNLKKVIELSVEISDEMFS